MLVRFSLSLICNTIGAVRRMNKKRAVLVSTTQPKGMGKSKSAKHNLPLPALEHFEPGTRSGELAKMPQDEMIESHLAS